MADITAQAMRTIEQHQMLQKGDTVIVACSGGADSVALFHFLYANTAQLGITLRCAHINHGLRGAHSDADAAFVARLCAAWQVPLESITLVPPAHPDEAWARQERYAFLQRAAAACGAKIATAHTANDNAETVLLHLARGTGVHGAAGIPPVRKNIVRPFLDCTRTDVEQYLAWHNLCHCTDATNAQPIYARNRVRHTVLPAFETVHGGARQALLRFAQDMRETADYLDAQAEALLQQANARDKAGEAYWHVHLLAQAPVPVCKAALRLLIAPYADPTAARIGLAYAALQQKNGAVQLCAAATLSAAQGKLRILHGSTPELSWEMPLFTGMNSIPGGFLLTVHCKSYEEIINFEKQTDSLLKSCADYGKIQCNTFFRTRRAGDSFAPAGRGVTKSLKKLFSEAGLSAAMREKLPVLARGHTVLWVLGFGFAQSVQPDAATKQIVWIDTDIKEG